MRMYRRVIGSMTERTTRIVRASIPGESSSAVGSVALVTMPLPPWEQPMTKDEAWQEARNRGAYVRTVHKEPKVKK